MPRARPSKRASSPAAASRCFARARALADVKLEDHDEQVGVDDRPPRARSALCASIVAERGPGRRHRCRQGAREQDDYFGYNAQTEVYEDLVKAGVIDPAKVTRTALQNAASISGLMLTTEATVSELPEKKDAAPMPQGHDDY